MRQCSIHLLKPGMIVGQPVYMYLGGRRTLLLGRNAEITSNMIDKLLSMGFPHIYVQEPGTEDIIPDDILSDDTRDRALSTISEIYDQINKAVSNPRSKYFDNLDVITTNHLDIPVPSSRILRDRLREVIQDLFIIGSVRGYEPMAALSTINPLHNHVLNVAVISLLIGWQYTFSDSEQISLGMGALFHDLGKTVLPSIYTKRFWELKSEEKQIWKHHPELGEKLLINDRDVSEIERQIIIQHHEQQDGNGFPFGLKGQNKAPVKTTFHEQNQIFRFAEIITVANVFDNLISGDTVSSRLSPQDALIEMAQMSKTVLNKDIVRTLNGIIIRFPVASNVQIISHSEPGWIGCKGVVAHVEQAFKPVEVVVLYNPEGRRISPKRILVDSEKNENLILIDYA